MRKAFHLHPIPFGRSMASKFEQQTGPFHQRRLYILDSIYLFLHFAEGGGCRVMHVALFILEVVVPITCRHCKCPDILFETTMVTCLDLPGG